MGTQTLEAALPWLRSAAGNEKPFFFFFHAFEPHTPYEAPARFADLGRTPYDREIAAVDEVVGELLAELKRLEVYDDA